MFLSLIAFHLHSILDYDPADYPVIYPGEDLQTAVDRERENQRKQQEEEEARQAQTESNESVPDIDVRFNENQNEIETDRETARKNYATNTPEYLTTTTTVRPTKRRPNKSDPICKLPTEPEYDVGFEAGYRFGTTAESRIEYTDIPAKFKKGYELSLEFKTDQPNGVLFYAADSRHTDFIVLFLKDGYVSLLNIQYPCLKIISFSMTFISDLVFRFIICSIAVLVQPI